MNNTLIYIDGAIVDLSPDTVISYTFKVFEIGDITSRNANYTNQFQIPITENNRRILGHAEDIKSLTDIPYKKLTAKVVVNGIEIVRDAKVFISKSDTHYNMQMFSGSFSFFDAITERTLSDLFQDKSPQLTDYPLTNSLLEPIFFNDGTLNEGSNPMNFSGRLMVRFKDVLDQIIADSGYTASGDILSDTTLNALYFLAYDVEGQYNEKFRAPREFSALRDTSVVFNATSSYQKMNFNNVLSNGGFYDGTNTYQVTDSIFEGTYFLCRAYAVIVIDDISFDDGAGRIGIELFSSSGSYLVNDITEPGTYLLELSDNVANDPSGNPVTDVVGIDGQQIYVQIRALDVVGFPTGTAAVTFGEGTGFRVECLRDNPKATQYINLGGVMPNLLQIDFLKDFAVRFAVLFKELNGVLICKTISEIINDGENAVDWTSKRDHSRVEEVIYEYRNYAKNNYFRHENEDDQTDETTGQGNISIQNENLESELTVYTSPFKSSVTRKNGNYNTGFVTCAVIPIDDDGNETDPGLRALLVRNPHSFEAQIDLGDGATHDYKIGYFEDVDGIEGRDASFKCAIRENYTTLAKFLQKAKVVTRYYFLNEVDILNLDLFKLVYDDGSYFMINTVENFVPGQSTKVQLFKVNTTINT